MDIFRLRNHLTRDYADYVRSFIRIGSPDVRAVVKRALTPPGMARLLSYSSEPGVNDSSRHVTELHQRVA